MADPRIRAILLGAAVVLASAIGPASATAAVAPPEALAPRRRRRAAEPADGLVRRFLGDLRRRQVQRTITEFNTDGSSDWPSAGTSTAVPPPRSVRRAVRQAQLDRRPASQQADGIARIPREISTWRTSTTTSLGVHLRGTFEPRLWLGRDQWRRRAADVYRKRVRPARRAGTPGNTRRPAASPWDRRNVYVADEGNNRISVSTPTGTFVRAFGWGVTEAPACRSAQRPARQACQVVEPASSAAARPHPRHRHSLRKPIRTTIASRNSLRPEGSPGRSAGMDQGTAPGPAPRSAPRPAVPDGHFPRRGGLFESAYAVAPDAFGNVYAADVNNERINEFTKTGAFVKSSAGSGSGPVCV